MFSNIEIKKEFKRTEIKEIKSTTTGLVTNYQVEVVNDQGETGVIELVQEGSNPMTIVNVKTTVKKEETRVEKVVKTETKV